MLCVFNENVFRVINLKQFRECHNCEPKEGGRENNKSFIAINNDAPINARRSCRVSIVLFEQN